MQDCGNKKYRTGGLRNAFSKTGIAKKVPLKWKDTMITLPTMHSHTMFSTCRFLSIVVTHASWRMLVTICPCNVKFEQYYINEYLVMSTCVFFKTDWKCQRINPTDTHDTAVIIIEKHYILLQRCFNIDLSGPVVSIMDAR